MIAPMKKVCIVLKEEDRRSALYELRRAGMIHIERIVESASGNLAKELDTLQCALSTLSGHKKTKQKSYKRTETLEQAHKIGELKDRVEVLETQLIDNAKAMEILKPWGRFDPSTLRILAEKGVDIRLVHANPDIQKRIQEDESVTFFPLRKKRDTVSGAAVYLQKPKNGGIPGISLPEYSIREIEENTAEIKTQLEALQKEIASHASCRLSLERAMAAVRQDMEFEGVNASLSGDEGLVGFTGFIPQKNVGELKSLAADGAWAVGLGEPDENDAVPTLMKNPKPVSIVQPVFDLMGLAPGYREMDISFWFLSFLSIFAAMILGDAAYGLIILLAVGITRIAVKKPARALNLLAVFGTATFIWGLITGTWFSSLALVRDTPLKLLTVKALATYQQELFPGYTVEIPLFPGNELDAAAMVKWISLLLGAVMLTIARLQNFFRKLPSFAAIAQLGWLSIVFALYWLIMNLVLQLSPLPILMNLVAPMAGAGLCAVIVFGGQKRGQSFIKGLLEGLKNILPTSLNAIGAFGDIISFIRLFAVGLAGVALAQSFNEIALGGGGLSVIAVLVLLLGHSLNIILSALSVLVHGVRLNLLEFSGHLDMEWSGIAYDPFRLRVEETAGI